MVIHVPHSSQYIPAEYRDDFILSESELKAELLRITDHYTDELFDIPGVVTHINQISRLVMDPERFRSDADEPIAKKGMGFAYTHTSQGKLLRVLSAAKRDQILSELYDPYHIALTNKVDRILAANDSCLILDAHSFPSKPLPYEDSQSEERPDICLGYEEIHLAPQVLQLVRQYFLKNQLTVSLNKPFAGSLVPMKYYRLDSRVQSLMVELNRSLYMNEENGEKLPSFSELRDLIHGFIACLESDKS
jgi:N-formylglutamate deformylase